MIFIKSLYYLNVSNLSIGRDNIIYIKINIKIYVNVLNIIILNSIIYNIKKILKGGM